MINPQQFNLPTRTVLEQIGDSNIALVINRKSRIIMADGRKILEKAQAIKAIKPDVTVVLKTTAPVCSKTKAFLKDAGIQVITV